MSNLLVIGNGFDLSIGARSSYCDFFESEIYRPVIESMERWTDDVSKLGLGVLDSILDERMYFTCWDLLFYHISIDQDGSLSVQERGRDINWCDIENVMNQSFTGAGFNWEECRSMVCQYGHDITAAQEVFRNCSIMKQAIHAYFIYHHWEKDADDDESFYRRLLGELNLFESRFGKYIERLTEGDEYTKLSRDRIMELVNGESVEYIDSFNYSDAARELNATVRHINGNTVYPIFGIDLKEDNGIEIPPQVRLFTKTSRRMHQDASGEGQENIVGDIDKIIVFGHSLNEQDYDYYVYLLTLLRFNTYDINRMGTIEFVFHAYDQSKRSEIAYAYTEAVHSLLSYYDRFMNNGKQTGLINLLRFSGKLVIREVSFTVD